MVHAVLEVDAVLFDGERVRKSQQLDLSEKKNRDCATSFLEIYVQLYDFEEFCRRMKQNRIKSKYLRNVDFTKLLITDCRI